MHARSSRSIAASRRSPKRSLSNAFVRATLDDPASATPRDVNGANFQFSQDAAVLDDLF